MNKPLISICIPTFNRATKLHNCLKSIEIANINNFVVCKEFINSRSLWYLLEIKLHFFRDFLAAFLPATTPN